MKTFFTLILSVIVLASCSNSDDKKITTDLVNNPLTANENADPVAMPVIEVPPECFKPAPKVDSAVIRLIPKKPEQRTAKSVKILNTVCLEAFNQRRKTLRNSLGNLLTAEEMASIGVDATLRAESLSLQQFIDIANWIYDKEQ